MLAAELHGKIADSSPPNQRMEDVLTSYALSIFRYLTDLRLITNFLSCAKNLKNETLNIVELKAIHVYFWPRFGFKDSRLNREADALIILEEDIGRKTAIVVEAKYESGLSNLYSPEAGSEKEQKNIKDETVIQVGHQLADEYCGIKCGHWYLSEEIQKDIEEAQKKLLLYITANYEMPKTEIHDTSKNIRELRKCKGAKNSCALAAEADIYWLSWRELHAFLEKQKTCGYPNCSVGERNYLDDLREVLILRNLECFQPFQSLEAISPYERLFKMHEFFHNLSDVEGYDSFFKASR